MHLALSSDFLRMKGTAIFSSVTLGLRSCAIIVTAERVGSGSPRRASVISPRLLLAPCARSHAINQATVHTDRRSVTLLRRFEGHRQRVSPLCFLPCLSYASPPQSHCSTCVDFSQERKEIVPLCCNCTQSHILYAFLLSEVTVPFNTDS